MGKVMYVTIKIHILQLKVGDNMDGPDTPKPGYWKLYLLNYLRIIPFWLILWFSLDRYYDYTSSMFLFFKGWLLLFTIIAILVLNPFLALALAYRQLKALAINNKPSLFKPFITVLALSLLFIFSPWIIAPIHTQLNVENDRVVANQLTNILRTEKKFEIQLTNYHNQRNVLDSDWLSLIVILKVKNFEGHYYSEVGDLLRKVDFKRDTIIIMIEENKNIPGLSSKQFEYDAKSKKLSE